MTRFLLDTNVISDLFRGHAEVMAGFRRHAPQDLGISTLTVMEIEYGMERQPQARKKFGELWEGLQADLTLLPFEAPDARHTAQIRAALAAAGTPIGPFDLQLAGTARARRLTLITHNTAEFARVPDLKWQDWRTD
ncbi:PIN domain-containing protein [Deinococcus budaensis]|uniref:Ribonuclease VapC n=1 Tax=Deinococcus budaensis TaxID=1665626 RepID=A0A7W8LR68_9DEIO|nr:PIN domain-containing protein [Deinococcus budaensis]MBB5235593.1 tRNA(fMet)-specific endonuclease VapC [Deinococcus budaensis]